MNELLSTLVLDRDGVINKRLPDQYIRHFDEFEFLPKVLDALKVFRERFDYIFIVTNQQGIGKKLMTEEELNRVHILMEEELHEIGVRLDGIYYCPELADKKNSCRKPNLHMAKWIQNDFPKVRFKNAVMIGDSASDLVFGRRLQMTNVWIRSEPEREQALETDWYDFSFESLWEAACHLDEIELELWT